MDASVGKTGVVSAINKSGIELKCPIAWAYPFFVLEVVEKADPWKVIHKEKVNNMANWAANYKVEISRCMTNIEQAPNREAAHQAKKELLQILVSHLPLSAGCCMFCPSSNISKWVCLNCPYARSHGICYDIGSDFREISDTRSRLISVIEEKY